MSKPTILLVEDNDNDRLIALRALREQAEEVHVARDGQEALELLDLAEGQKGPAVRPDVVFLDLKMPRLDGPDVLRQMRSADHTRSIPVVVLSASDREEDVRECYRLGANSFLVKRFDSKPPGAYLSEAAHYWTRLNRSPRLAGGRKR